ncbi:MAG TPA: hypothetical protein VFF81_12600 [Noviherbaspirillum sp.]|nr:hypothetical protein [Noviherbaspirillum sp.]
MLLPGRFIDAHKQCGLIRLIAINLSLVQLQREACLNEVTAALSGHCLLHDFFDSK